MCQGILPKQILHKYVTNTPENIADTLYEIMILFFNAYQLVIVLYGGAFFPGK
jgi:hypothetical protein